MAPRRRKVKRSRRKTFSLLTGLESYMYANVLSQGLMGTSPWGVISGATDLGQSMQTIDLGAGGRGNYQQMTTVGGKEISLGDIISEPGLALATMGSNFENNIVNMGIQSFLIGASFKFGRRLLRRPLSSVSRNVLKPIFGPGVRA